MSAYQDWADRLKVKTGDYDKPRPNKKTKRDMTESEAIESYRQRKKEKKRHDRTGHPIAFCLSSEDIDLLLRESGITIWDVSVDGYHLSRFDDLGDYVVGNCRFVTAQENHEETKHWKAGRECVVEGIPYRSIAEAVRESGWSRSTISKRAKSGVLGWIISPRETPERPL